MRTISLTLTVLALLGVLAACGNKVVPSNATPAPSEYSTRIELVLTREAAGSYTTARAFPVGQSWFYNDSVGTWPNYSSAPEPRFQGKVRYALARWVTDLQLPQPQPGETPEWVLFTSQDPAGSILGWRETTWKQAGPGLFESAAVELPISQTLIFDAGATTREGFDNLIALRDSLNQPGKGLWVEVLVTEVAGEGSADPVWVTHMFSKPPFDPGDQDEKRTVCCDQLRCDLAAGWWAGWCWVKSCSTIVCNQ